MKFISSFVFMILCGSGIGQSWAQGPVTFGPQEAKIEGAISYSVLGKYTARFSDFKGSIVFDENSQRVRSVYLAIEVPSIHSNCPWCDKMVRSRRLLNTRKYPKIVFKSSKVIQGKDGYQVKGILEMHGVKQKMIFPFKIDNIVDQNTRRRWIDIKGRWNINRKDFNIVWSRTLDHGGVVVGDIFTVNWRIFVTEAPS